MPESLPEELYVPEEEIVIHSRMPVSVKLHTEKYYFYVIPEFQFYEDFVEDPALNWLFFPDSWALFTTEYHHFPNSIRPVSIAVCKITRKNLSIPTARIEFWVKRIASIESWGNVIHESYGPLDFRSFTERWLWLHFRAIFFYDNSSKSRKGRLFKEENNEWILKSETDFGSGIPANGTIGFELDNDWVERYGYFDEISCWTV